MPDLFEQLVGDYLTGKGYLCNFNVSYRKADGRGAGSDIDVLAMRQPPPHDVIVGECKSWEVGVRGQRMVDNPAHTDRRYFKPLFEEEWADGLAAKVREEFGQKKGSTYVIYCARLRDDGDALRKRRVAGNRVQVVTLDEMIRDTNQRLDDKQNHSVEPTTLGRFVQLMRHAGIKLEFP